MTQNQVLTLSDLAQLEGVHYLTAYRWLREGAFGDVEKLPRTSGNLYLIPRARYEQWKAQRKQKHEKDNNRR